MDHYNASGRVLAASQAHNALLHGRRCSGMSPASVPAGILERGTRSGKTFIVHIYMPNINNKNFVQLVSHLPHETQMYQIASIIQPLFLVPCTVPITYLLGRDMYILQNLSNFDTEKT